MFPLADFCGDGRFSQFTSDPELGRMAHQRIKNSTLVTFAELGHSPQVQEPARFNKALLEHVSRFQ